MREAIEGKGTVHAPVLLQSVIEGLSLKLGDTVVDGTLGGGGHAEAIIPRIGPTGTYIGIDLDQEAIARTQLRLSGAAAKVVLVENNYRNLQSILSDLRIHQIDRMLIDLGLSSDQLESSGRGFSFQRDEPLSMAFTKSQDGLRADDAVNHWSEESLADVIYVLGEEPKARQIAKAIIMARGNGPIETSKELADIIAQVIKVKGRIHPATKTFQALRMAVNDELGSLEEGLEASRMLLSRGGRIAVISFESITDRMVKRTFAEWTREGDMRNVTKRPTVASRDEIRTNPRSRSAKLRIAEKITSPT